MSHNYSYNEVLIIPNPTCIVQFHLFASYFSLCVKEFFYGVVAMSGGTLLFMVIS